MEREPNDSTSGREGLATSQTICSTFLNDCCKHLECNVVLRNAGWQHWTGRIAEYDTGRERLASSEMVHA